MKAGALLLDSSVWIELIGRGPLVAKCAAELASAQSVIVPTVVLFEVYRKVQRAISEEEGLRVVGLLSQHQVAELSREIALDAADLSLAHKLPMADALVLAHAHAASATLITLDNDFAGLPRVKVLRK